MKELIAAVRAEPALWQPNNPDYRVPKEKFMAWERVVSKCSSIPDVMSAKLEWKRLRDNHRDAIKRAKLGKNKLLPAQVSTWKHAKDMQFLEPYMKYRITENIEMEPTFMDGDVSTSYGEESCQPKKIRKISEDQRDNEPQPKINVEMTPKVKPRQEQDALDSFFSCILQSTREMPQWMQRQVKKKIFDVLMSAEEELSENNQNTSNNESNSQISVLETRSQSVPSEIEIKTEIYSSSSDDD